MGLSHGGRGRRVRTIWKVRGRRPRHDPLGFIHRDLHLRPGVQLFKHGGLHTGRPWLRRLPGYSILSTDRLSVGDGQAVLKRATHACERTLHVVPRPGCPAAILSAVSAIVITPKPLQR